MDDPPDFTAIRPRMRGDSTLVPGSRAVVFENDTQSFALQGPGLHPLLQALLPFFDGERTVSQILEATPVEVRETVAALIALLLDRTFLVDQPQETDVDLPAAVRARFAPQIEFLTHVTERPMASFQRFRHGRILLAGSGPAFAAGAAALLRYGLQRLDLLPTAPTNGLDEVAEVRESLRAMEVESSAVIAASRLEGARELLSELDLVLFISDRSAFSDLLWLNRECARVRRPLLPALVLGRRSLLGPVMEPPAIGCWVCGLCRQAGDLLDADQLAEFHQAHYPEGRVFEQERDPDPTLAGMLGRDAAFEALKLVAGGARSQVRQGVLVTLLDGPGSFAAELQPFPLGGCTRYCDPFCSG